MFLRHSFFLRHPLTVTIFGLSTLAFAFDGLVFIPRAFAQAEAAVETETQDAAQAKLDEAAALKLSASGPDDLGKVISLCEQALVAGLDGGNERLAKQLIAASAFARAEAMLQQLPGIANNRRAVQKLRQRTMDELEKALENNPSMAEALVLMAKAETLPGGSIPGAIDHLNKAIELLKDKPVDQSAAYILRAQLREDEEDRIKDLRLAIKADSTNSGAWQALVLMQFTLNKFEDAIADAKLLLEQDPDNVIALQASVEALLSLKKADEVVDLLTPRIEAKPEKGDYYRYRAAAYRQKSYDEGLSEAERTEINELAMTDLNKAIELDNRDAAALIMRGTLHYELGNMEKAKRDISDSLLINPDSVNGVFMRSMMAAQEGRFADAIADMEMLVRTNPGNVQWIEQLAMYYQADDRPRLAIQLLDRLIERDPKNWGLYRMRGDSKLSTTQHDEAIADYESAVTILEEMRGKTEGPQVTDEQYSGLLNNLAWVLATSPNDELRDGKRSLELGLKASEATNFEAAHILSTLAAGYAEVGDFENARKWASKAVELGEDEEHDQLEQLKKELESYKQDKPWREEQAVEENAKPLAVPSDTIDT